MKSGFYPIIKAIPAIVVGIAFFLSACQPKPILERPVVKEPVHDFFALAEQDLHAGNYDKALEEYDLYLKEKPKGERSRTALYRMAMINFNKNLYDRALTLFKRIIREYPGHPDLPVVKYDIANTYYLTGDYRRSEIEASEWIRMYPENPLKGEVLFLMGKNFIGLSNYPQAFYWLLESYEEFPDSPTRQDEIDKRITGLIKRSRLEDLKEMAGYADKSRYSPPVYHRIASIYLDNNNLEGARDAALDLIRSTQEKNWISIGKGMLARIEEELSVRVGVIGCLLPLSGPFSIYGQEVLNGIQLGMGIFNGSEEGEGLELIIMDTKGKKEAAVSGVEELANNEKVMAIIGPLVSKPAIAAARKAQELGVPIITMAQKEEITDEGDLVFRNFLIPSKEINRVLDKAMGEMAWKRFGILYPDNSYGRFFMNLFWDKVEEMDGIITAVESYQPDETDFAVEIKKMVGLYYPRPESVKQMLNKMKYLEAEGKIEKRRDPDGEPEPIVDFDAVFIPANYQQVSLIAPQFPFHNIFNIRLLGTSLWQSDELIETTGDYVQGAIFSSGFFAESESIAVKDFVELYEENFESEPGILSATGYDTMRFIKNLMEKSSLRTRKDFRMKLVEYDDYYGVTGKVAFDHQGEVVKAPILLTISGQHFQVLPCPPSKEGEFFDSGQE